MLKSFRVDNFKSLLNIVFDPIGLNLLVGTNNAGKTNLCHALRFLSLTSRMPLVDATKASTAEPWNMLNVYFKKQSVDLAATCGLVQGEETLSFSYELELESRGADKSQVGSRVLSVATETLRVSGQRFPDTKLLENKRGKVRLLHEKRFLRGLAPGSEPEYIETTAPTDTTMLSRLYDLETNQRANLFKRYLGSWGYFNFDAGRLRSSTARALDAVLDSDGGNLSSVLYTLHNNNPRVERRIIEAAKLLEPRLDVISFQSPDPENVYMYFEDKAGNKFGVQNLSEGTLRYLAMCYVIITGRDAAAERGGPPVIIIEEPEDGIYVGYLKDLFERIEPSGEQGQFVFTSHNPYFIDLFDAALDGLFLMKRGEQHSSLIKPDPAKLGERLGKFSLGEMHFRELLE